MSTIRGLIFDLDDTLFDCTGQLTEPARQRASSILARDLPNVHPDHLTTLQRDLSTRAGSTAAIRQIGKRYGIADAVEQGVVQVKDQPANRAHASGSLRPQ